MDLIKIRWVDSAALHGWQDREHALELTGAETVIQSVGYLLDESEHSITIVQSYHDDNGDVSAVLQIPKVAIVEVSRIHG